MRLRVLLLLVAIGILIAAGSVTHNPHARARQDASQGVSLGGAIFSPSGTTPTGTSRFMVAVSTGAHVPAQGLDGTPIKAVVRVQELNNFNGTELFGDVTPQMSSPTPNGFVALSLYDTDLNGGNGDGIIDSRDAVYTQLRLWQDRNHNGVSEPSELRTLAESGVASISLDFKESKQRDQFGNLFRFRARVEPVRRAEAAKWAWDVFLLSQ